MDPERSEAPAEDDPSTDPVVLGPPRTGSPFEPNRLGSILGPNRPAFRFGRHKPAEVPRPEEIPRETVVPEEPVDAAPVEDGAATSPTQPPAERSGGVDVLDLLGVAVRMDEPVAVPIDKSDADQTDNADTDPDDEPEVVTEAERVDKDASARPVDEVVAVDEVVVVDEVVAAEPRRPTDLVDESDPVAVDDTLTVLGPDAALETVADDTDDDHTDDVDGEIDIADEVGDQADRGEPAFEAPDEDVAPGVGGFDDRFVTASRASLSEWPSADTSIAPEDDTRPPSDDPPTTPEFDGPPVEFEDELEAPPVDTADLDSVDLDSVDLDFVDLVPEDLANEDLDSVDLVPVDLDSVDLLGDEPAFEGSAPSVHPDAGPPAIEVGRGDDDELVLEVAAHRPVMIDRRSAVEVDALNPGTEPTDAERSADVEPMDLERSADVEPMDLERSADVEPMDLERSADVEPMDLERSADVEPMDAEWSADIELSSDDEPRLPTMDQLRSMADELDEVDAILARLDADPYGLEAVDDGTRDQVADLASAE